MKDWARILSRITLVSQLGLTLVTPPLLCILGALWAQKRFGIGDWLLLCAILVGVLSGVCGMADLICAELRRDRRSEKSETDGNRKSSD